MSTSIQLNSSKLGVDKTYTYDLLRQALDFTKEGLLLGAKVVAAYDKAGWDVPKDFPSTWLAMCRNLASGRTLIEICFDFMTKREFPIYVQKYPIEDQKLLAEGSLLDVVVIKNGTFDSRKMKIDEIQGIFRKQVFGRESLRNKRAQQVWIEKENAELALLKNIEVKGDFWANKKEQAAIVRFGKKYIKIPKKDLLRMIGEL